MEEKRNKNSKIKKKKDIQKTNDRIVEVETKNEFIPINPDIYDVSPFLKSVCKIDTNKGNATGFLLKLNNENNVNFFCLMTNEHVITKEMIGNKEKITIFFGKKQLEQLEIKLNKDDRIIKEYKNSDLDLDITIVEIIKKDKINEKYFLLPDMNIENEKNNLINKEIFVVEFPHGKLGYSKGEIKEIKQYEITHNANTNKDSSGSRIILANQKK